MQSYTIITMLLESIGVAVGIIIILAILTYFTKELIRNFKGKNSKYYYDTQKDVQRKIKREQEKLDKFLQKQLKKVRKVRNL